MNYEKDLRAIDEGINTDYEKLVAERYLPVFSAVIADNAGLLIDKNIPAIKLGLRGRLDFLQTGEFMYDKNCIFPQKTEKDNLNGLLAIAKIYKDHADYGHSVQNALKICLSEISLRVRVAIRNKQDSLANRL